MFNFFKRRNILTHDGKFHADDVFSVATLSVLYDGKIKITRSRNPEIIKSFLEKGDIILDNGRDYNPDKNIFDHHQEGGAGARESGVPYAGFGLIWKHFGKQVCLKELKKQNSKFKKEKAAGENNLNEIVEYVWQQVDSGIVSNIDATDTSYTDYYSEKTHDSGFVPDKIVGSFMPGWQEDYFKADKIFAKLVKASKLLIVREIKLAYYRFLSKSIIEEIYKNSPDKRIIILEQGCPWKEILVEKPEPLFVVYPTVNKDGYSIQAVPLKKDSQEIRRSFPKSWCGKTDADLEKVSGVKGAKFCHNSGFLAGAYDFDGAKQLAKKALE
jgi:uncharacterized UPF0160 family protein